MPRPSKHPTPATTPATSADEPRSTWTEHWARILERRDAQRELDQLADQDPYPDPVALYCRPVEAAFAALAASA